MNRSETPLRDAEARRAIAEDLQATLFVEAAAGTGKTTALVGRIVSLLCSGAGTLEGIAAVTFTEKAAGEMKLRLRAELERARGEAREGGVERGRLEAALEQLELARIGTIHAFCADLLHERPVEAGVDPLFEVLSEDEAQRLLERAFDAWFEQTLSGPPEGVRRALRRRPRSPDARGPRVALRGAAAALIEHRDFEAAWHREPFDRAAAVDAALQELEALAALAPRAHEPEDWLAKNLAQVARFVAENTLREGVRGRDYDGLEAELRELARDRRVGWHWKGWRREWFGRDLRRDDVLARRDAAKRALDALVEAADADLAACLREELRPVVAAYQALKRRAGCLDFVDLLIGARDLLRRDRDVRTHYQQKYTHFFVDEFQDTDPLQAEILLLLAADDPEQSDWRLAVPVPGKLFLVGDPKQAIYRFRRADVAIYEETKRRLREQGARVIYLTTSFRAPPALQEAVNAAFAPVMQGAADGSQAEYVPLEPAREDAADRPSLVVLPAPRPYGDYGRIASWRAEESLADAVGAFVDWLVTESGWSVAERAGEAPVPIRPRHVCLLFRRFQRFRDDVTHPYVRALEARRVPHVLVGGRSFHEREEVLAIRSALCAVEWPDDELHVFAALRGPFFALGDDALLAYRHRRDCLHPMRRRETETLETEDERAVAQALDVLARLHVGRNQRPISETILRLLDATRAHAGVAIWPTGEQALANCLRSVDLARRFERRGAVSFRAFVERMEEEAERGGAQDAPAVEEGTEGVRIMTVHRAKGLEFPVVVLCEPACRAAREQPTRHVDAARGLWAEPLAGCAPRELLACRADEQRRDAAEAVRLTYVAATRARDLLVVPGVADAEPAGGWLEALNPVVYPEADSRGEATPASGCPAFERDAVLERPPGARPERTPVAPGRLRPRAGTHSVVWWDPQVLRLDVSQDVGLRQQRILEADREGIAATEGERAHARWQERRRETLERGMAPSRRVEAVTALAAEAAAAPGSPEISIEEVSAERDERPHGKRFGTLVHAVLAAADLAADEASVRATTALQGRLVGASDEEVAAAARAAVAALHHPVLRDAARSPALRRETPVLLRLDDGRLAEGVVDLAFLDADAARWTGVDFKTDRELGARRAEYEAQLGLYVQAVAHATREPARGVLLVV
ncbi:MAG TPA: UvrD-helicase domain-containing protein [Myxococcota bacterium]